MKTCCKCKLELSLDAFNKRKASKDGLQSICRECWKSYYKEQYYDGSKEKVRLQKKNAIYRNKAREIIREAKSVACADCGVRYPYYVMDFDHLDNKEFNLGRYAGKSIPKIKEEIAKCEVVCSNCHRIRTYNRANAIPDTLLAG
jgi:hypothetical protein